MVLLEDKKEEKTIKYIDFFKKGNCGVNSPFPYVKLINGDCFQLYLWEEIKVGHAVNVPVMRRLVLPSNMQIQLQRVCLFTANQTTFSCTFVIIFYSGCCISAAFIILFASAESSSQLTVSVVMFTTKLLLLRPAVRKHLIDSLGQTDSIGWFFP